MEFHMSHESMPIAEERNMVRHIKKLQDQRQRVRQYEAQFADVEEARATARNNVGQLKELQQERQVLLSLYHMQLLLCISCAVGPQESAEYCQTSKTSLVTGVACAELRHLCCTYGSILLDALTMCVSCSTLGKAAALSWLVASLTCAAHLAFALSSTKVSSTNVDGWVCCLLQPPTSLLSPVLACAGLV